MERGALRAASQPTFEEWQRMADNLDDATLRAFLLRAVERIVVVSAVRRHVAWICRCTAHNDHSTTWGVGPARCRPFCVSGSPTVRYFRDPTPAIPSRFTTPS